MQESCNNQIMSEDYADFIFDYEGNTELLERLYQPDCINLLNWRNVLLHIPLERLNGFRIEEFGYDAMPKCYGLCDVSACNAAGINRLKQASNYSLRGEGVLIGFVDTGIDYRHPAFRNEDGTSRIYSIWDQTIRDGPSPSNINYGTEYTKERIDQALCGHDSQAVVPSMDENGHGTFLAGIAAGQPDLRNDFNGVATGAEIIMVKLKQAKKFTRDFFRIPDGVLCYQETDIMFGIRYLLETARSAGRPLVICIALGGNHGGHEGRAMLSDYLSYIAGFFGVCVVVAAGNEGNRRHHFYGTIDTETKYLTMELRVGENENNFALEIWGNAPNTYSIDILSPTGEYIPRIPARLGENRDIRFLLENTNLAVDYRLIESQSGDQLILLRFERPAAGIWRFRIYGEGDTNPGIHAWLPIDAFITEDTIFLNSDPDTTITTPGDAYIPITVTAYNHQNDSIYYYGGRGFTRVNVYKPELAAPGVNLLGPLLNDTYGYSSGTSTAAGFTAGVAALIFEIQREFGSQHMLSTLEIKHLMIRGAERKTRMEYPSKEWGYGAIDLYGAVESLRQ